MLTGLRRQHPKLEFELVLSNTVDNLLRRDADIAVRMVEPTQEALSARRLGPVILGLYAHKDYLSRAGTPAALGDLVGHSLIGFDRETPAIRAMRSRVPGAEDLRFAFRADSDIAQWRAIKAGFGIGICQVGLAGRRWIWCARWRTASISSSACGSPCMRTCGRRRAAAPCSTV